MAAPMGAKELPRHPTRSSVGTHGRVCEIPREPTGALEIPPGVPYDPTETTWQIPMRTHVRNHGKAVKSH